MQPEIPTRLSHLLLPTPDAKEAATGFIEGALYRLLLSGPPGTGKSATAKVLIMERIRNIQWHFDVVQFNASVDGTVGNLRAKFSALTVWAHNQEGIRAMVIEEIDRLSNDAKLALKGHLDHIDTFPQKIPIIATTNEIDKVDAAVRDRFYVVTWEKPPANEIMARAKDVLKSQKVTFDDEAIRQMIEEADRGVRKLFNQIMPREVLKHRRGVKRKKKVI